jgi:hypothetical protein
MSREISAFPRAASPENGCDYEQDGMGLRDYFAAHAPSEIPEWFEHDYEAEEIDAPQWSTLPLHLQQAARDWINDPSFDLAEMLDADEYETDEYSKDYGALSAFETHWREYRIKLSVRSATNKIARYVQWPWAYADLMLAERTNVPAPSEGPKT